MKNVFKIVLCFFKANRYYFTICIVFFSCKRDHAAHSISPEQQSFIDNIDSIQRYAREIYLWNDQLQILNKQDLLTTYPFHDYNIENYRLSIGTMTKTAIDPDSGFPFEYNIAEPAFPKYSTIAPNFSSQPDNLKFANKSYHIDNDFGMALFSENDDIFILYVDQNSPAGKMKLKRGDRIITMNDQAVDSNNYLRLWSQAAQESFVKFIVQPVGAASKEIRLMGNHYQRNPVLAHRALKVNGRMLGYIAYADFAPETVTKEYLQPVFAQFQKAGVEELIVDLRYNGGGYQNTAIYLANQLIGDQANGQLMFTEHYNSRMQEGEAVILKNQIIKNADNSPVYLNGRVATLFDIDYSVKANTIEFEEANGFKALKRVYFIVSQYTASASELLINVLKPYMDVCLIGVSLDGQQTVKTFGKPVGFFDVDIGAYKLYLAMYQTKNAWGNGNYFQGMTANYSTYDNPRYDFGDLGDNAMKIILDQPSSRNSAFTTPKKSAVKNMHRSYVFDDRPASALIKDFKTFRLR